MNQRTLLRRNAPPSQELDRTLADIDRLLARIGSIESADVLLGMEGNVARLYFQSVAETLKPRDFDATGGISTAATAGRRRTRSTRCCSSPTRMLAKECTVALLAEGLDPYWGFYHRPRHGRPALALDLMEPFRPVIADSAVITAVNTGMVRRPAISPAAASGLRDERRRPQGAAPRLRSPARPARHPPDFRLPLLVAIGHPPSGPSSGPAGCAAMFRDFPTSSPADLQ